MESHEYGIKHHLYPDELWRGPWTRERCLEWLQSCHHDGIKDDVFYLVRRPVTNEWERAE
jgi:hypothetical protein